MQTFCQHLVAQGLLSVRGVGARLQVLETDVLLLISTTFMCIGYIQYR